MNKRKRAKAPERDLFGAELRPRLPLRKAVERPDGGGWDVGVRESGGTVYRHLGLSFPTRGDAWQAIRAGVGRDRESTAVTVNVTVVRLGRKSPR